MILERLTQAQFERYVPVATEATGQVWQRAQTALQAAASMLQARLQLTAPQLTAALDGAHAREHALRYLCTTAFAAQLASNDVVLSGAGFGVVSTANVAPASAHRVAALKEELHHTAGDAYDAMLEALMLYLAPEQSPCIALCQRQLVPTARIARELGLTLADGSAPYGEDWDKLMPRLAIAQGALCTEFSQKLVAAAATYPWRMHEQPPMARAGGWAFENMMIVIALRTALARYLHSQRDDTQWRDTCYTRIAPLLPPDTLAAMPYHQRKHARTDTRATAASNAFFWGAE